jgi:hypothetical protein
LDSLTSALQLDRCSPCWRIHCAEDTRQERGVFPVSPRIAAPHRVVHTRIGAHRRARTMSGGARAPHAPARLPRPLRLRGGSSDAATRPSRRSAGQRPWTSSSRLRARGRRQLGKGRRECERAKVTPHCMIHPVSPSLTLGFTARPLFAARAQGVLRRRSTRAQYRHTTPHVPPGASRMGAVRRAGRTRAPSLRIPATSPPAVATRCGSSSTATGAMWRCIRARARLLPLALSSLR